MNKLSTLSIFAIITGIILSSCKGMPTSFTAPCHEERALILMNRSDEVLTFYALDTGGYTIKTDVPPHTTQREWLKAGAWKFIVDNKDKKTINSFPGIEAYTDLENNTLDARFYKTVKTKEATWILWEIDTVAKFSYYDPAIWYDMTAARNYAVAPIDFMYGDDNGKDEAWFMKQLSKITPLFYSGKRPFIVYTKTNFNAKVFGPAEKFPKTLGKYDLHFCLTSLDTALGRDRASVTDRVIEDMMGRGFVSVSVDYGTSLRRLGDCK